MGRTIGIDLGTTNSVAAIQEDRIRVLPTSTGRNYTPSVVSLRANKRDPSKSEVLVGEAAVNFSDLAPRDTVFSIKRLMGRTFKEEQVSKVRHIANYTIEPDPQGADTGVRVVLGDRYMTPVEISSLILRRIKEDASKALGEPVTHAVITVPAYFEERQRFATRKAGEAAGLIVRKILEEPTAAAVAFGMNESKVEHRVLVFDLGGGTFDISILQMVANNFLVLEKAGDNWLGGDDFDRKIVEKMSGWIREKHGIDPDADLRYRLLAKKTAEKAKIELSGNPVADIFLPAAIRSPAGKTIDVETQITRLEFEDLIRPYVDRCIELVHRALKRQSLTPDDLSAVLMVGGSSFVPMVLSRVVEVFGEQKVRTNIDPMECVAVGAAGFAARLQGVECPKCQALNLEEAKTCSGCGGSLASARERLQGGTFDDVLQMSIGIQALKNGDPEAFVPIVEKGTPMPMQGPRKQIFHPTEEDSRLIRIAVYQGEGTRIGQNKLQGIIRHELPEPISKASPFEVSMDVTREGIISVEVYVAQIAYRQRDDLARDLADEAAGREGEAWRESLRRTVEVVEGFVEEYHDYIEPTPRTELEACLEKSRKAIEENDEKEGVLLEKRLQNLVFKCGLATRLFIAKQAILDAPAVTAEKIQKAINAVKKAHKEGDKETVKKLDTAIRDAVAQHLESRKDPSRRGPAVPEGIPEWIQQGGG